MIGLLEALFVLGGAPALRKENMVSLIWMFSCNSLFELEFDGEKELYDDLRSRY